MRVDPPATAWDLVEDEGSELRLTPVLRDAARTQNPIEILGRAAARFVIAERRDPKDEQAIALGNALADLAVTGRASYSVFTNQHGLGWDMAALRTATQLQLAGEVPAPSAAEIDAAIERAFVRAYDVAWALRGSVAERAARRPRLGWIAVSAEDDTPHRPVNVPAPPFEQYEVQVATGGVSVRTRYFVASPQPSPAAIRLPGSRPLPNDPVPNIPPDQEILLFLHGHSSGAEEALDIIPHLLAYGLKREKQYCVIAFDLPNNGYSETFDHTAVAPADATTYPRLRSDNGPIRTPILDFIEDFVVAFVDAVENVAIVNGTPRIKERITAVIGGSLGGNLGVRLGRRNPTPPWLKTIVAWSPASVWQPFAQDNFKVRAPNQCFAECVKPETDRSRADYFSQVYDKEAQPGIVKQQTKYWYRKKWELADHQISLSRLARREIYNTNYRRWHWRVAGEQLIYSHFDRVEHGDTTTPIRTDLNTVRTLLAAGEDDNYLGTKIYSNTKELGRAMGKAGGRVLRVLNTGHSIHIERPQYFAYEIVKFLNARMMQIDCAIRTEGRIQSVGGRNLADLSRFNLSLSDCMAAIQRGDEFFVLGVDGNRAYVTVHGRGANMFITTTANPTTADNLLLLPRCSP
ncbi:MAG TPA: alpha/beta fold hydrolase [Thermoanaerobaculia bacterium]|jgi:pimeloyl-ACP methyl ester carboxylesterase|nr:alpha/beta fold hydrolase [Thermoanaerobaculia bacterium]